MSRGYYIYKAYIKKTGEELGFGTVKYDAEHIIKNYICAEYSTQDPVERSQIAKNDFGVQRYYSGALGKGVDCKFEVRF